MKAGKNSDSYKRASNPSELLALLWSIKYFSAVHNNQLLCLTCGHILLYEHSSIKNVWLHSV